jgi:RNA polymerase sigma factor (sigma-70 family)
VRLYRAVDARSSLTDAQLLAATASDPDAFAAFYDRYEAPVVGYFMRRTGDPELAGDLTAEVFAAALRSAARYRPRGPTAAGWLFAIAANTLASSARRGRVEARARKRIGMRAIELQEESLQRAQASAGDAWVAELLERLPEDQREAVRARIIDERSYGEIARGLDTSEFVIRKRVSRGLATLREQLERPT